MSKVTVDKDVWEAYQAVLVSARRALDNRLAVAGSGLDEAFEQLDEVMDPYRDSKAALAELIWDGIEERERRNMTASERETVRLVVADIFNGSDFPQELTLVVLKNSLGKVALGDTIFGLFSKSTLIEVLEKEFFGLRTPEEQQARLIQKHIKPTRSED